MKRLALTFFLTVCLALPVSAEDKLPVFTVMGTCPDGTSFGTGFLAADWPIPGQTSLVTALHVVHGCANLSVAPATGTEASFTGDVGAFPWFIPKGSEVLTWPELDLAAVPQSVLTEAKIPLVPALRRGKLPDEYQQSTPRGALRPVSAQILGQTRDNNLPTHHASITGVTRVESVFANMKKRHVGAGTSAGSLAAKSLLLVCDVALAEGISGGPVVLASDGGVVGHVVMGVPGEISWALEMPTSLENHKIKKAKLEYAWDVGFSAPTFAVSEVVLSDSGERVEIDTLRGRKQVFLSAGVLLQAGLPRAASGMGLGFAARVHPELMVLDEAKSMSLAGMLSLEIAPQNLRQVETAYKGPDETELQRNKGPSTRTNVEGCLELRLRRLETVRPTMSLGARLLHQEHQAPGGTDGDWGFGFPVRFRISLSPDYARPSVALELAFILEQVRDVTYRYTGIGGATESRPLRWYPTASVGTFVEY